MLRYFLFFFLLFSTLQLSAQQPIPTYGSAFLQNEVAQIRITMHPDTLTLLLHEDNWGNDREFPATFQYVTGASSQTVQNIGFRLRGNTSIAAQKKSFKVSFNTYIQGAKWYGLEKLNLNGHHNDPAHIRAKLCWDLFREAELPCSRTSFIRLYVNNEYKGIYTNVEHIDEEFVKRHINGIGRGNLYKCLYPADLTYLGQNPENYKLEGNGRRVYEQKINDYADDYRDIAHFIAILNQTPEDDLPCQLEAIFNVDRYLRYAAMDVLTGNWDGYAYNKNNFYLYKNEKTGLFEYLPYDLDNTFGIDWFNIDWAERNIYNWAPGSQERPLFKRILQNGVYRQRFTNYIHQYINTVFTTANLTSKVNSYFSLISDAVLADTYRTLDYGFSFNDFLESGETAFGAHVKKGIIPYSQERISSAQQQLDFFQTNAAIQGIWMEHDFPVTTDGLVKALIYNFNDLPLWEWSTDRENWLDGSLMTDDGLQADEIAGDHVYTAAIPAFPDVDKIYFRVKFMAKGTSYLQPCDGRLVHIRKSTIPLYINELMADNTLGITDEEGDYDDWIEIYNGGNSSISLKDYFLTDSPLDRPKKFQLPDVQIAPNSFLLYWADNDHKKYRDHANFALGKSGEDLRIYKLEDFETRMVDRINYPEQQTNVSYGRQTDGEEPWITFANPTPRESNLFTTIAPLNSYSLRFYPNPAIETVYFNTTVKNICIMDIQGRTLIKSNNANSLNISEMANGIYFLDLDGQVERLIITGR